MKSYFEYKKKIAAARRRIEEIQEKERKINKIDSEKAENGLNKDLENL